MQNSDCKGASLRFAPYSVARSRPMNGCGSALTAATAVDRPPGVPGMGCLAGPGAPGSAGTPTIRSRGRQTHTHQVQLLLRLGPRARPLTGLLTRVLRTVATCVRVQAFGGILCWWTRKWGCASRCRIRANPVRMRVALIRIRANPVSASRESPSQVLSVNDIRYSVIPVLY